MGMLSCEKEEIAPSPLPTEQPDPAGGAYHYDRVEGFVQKGPFLNGTAMQVAELQQNLAQTGRNYSTQIVDNRGTFELYDVDFATPYVQLKADGFYYNEVSDETSAARLTLHAITNLAEHNALNVNLLTTLERPRVEYLVSRGSKFGLAKEQAQQEIFGIFEMGEGISANSELLDISQSGDDNAKLLALSVILQGALTEGELSELVANIGTDIREDGVLDSELLGSQLVNNAYFLQPVAIRENLEKRYASMGQMVTVPNFEPYLRQFLDNTDFAFTDHITYPEVAKFGKNLLSGQEPILTWGTHSLAVDLPRSGSVKVVIWGANWAFAPGPESTGWTYTDLNWEDRSRTFTSTHTGRINMQMELTTIHNGQDKYIYPPCNDPLPHNCPDRIPNPDYVEYPLTHIEVYENNDTVPIFTREFSVRPE